MFALCEYIMFQNWRNFGGTAEPRFSFALPKPLFKILGQDGDDGGSPPVFFYKDRADRTTMTFILLKIVS
jgi:hypothetical protein